MMHVQKNIKLYWCLKLPLEESKLERLFNNVNTQSHY